MNLIRAIANTTKAIATTTLIPIDILKSITEYDQPTTSLARRLKDITSKLEDAYDDTFD